MARKFLYIVAALIALVLAAGVVWQVYGTRLMQVAFVPKEEFRPLPREADRAYADKAMWIARPDIPGNPAMWQPKGTPVAEIPKARAAVFFIHPTSYLTRAHWNAPLDDKEANDRAALFVRGQASVFEAAGDIWAPRYRQATFGAFLTDDAQRQKALDAAYVDVAQAFDQFIKEAGNRRIILAGHSQGALHLIRLLKDKVAGTPLAKRIVAAYIVGWPISVEADLPALGLPVCASPFQNGCIRAWQSYGEPADTHLTLAAFDAGTGYTGKPRAETQMVCTNPLTTAAEQSAPASANLGTLKPNEDLSDGELIVGSIPARCDGRGFLLIGDPPKMGAYVLPGNNYHVYDYSLFWSNIRADAVNRTIGKRE